MTTNWRDRTATVFDCQKQPASGSRGMVVSNHPLASAAGAEMLAAGGHAIQAAISGPFALTRVAPVMVGNLAGRIGPIPPSGGRPRLGYGQSTVPRSVA